MHLRIGLVTLALITACTTANAQPCSHHLLVSGYFSDNVAIYNGCTGAFLRQLETGGRIDGAQAVRYNPTDDLIYVVSEGNDQIQRYRHSSSYEFVDVFAQLDSSFDPTGVAFGPNDEVYVASYSISSVIELNPLTGQPIGVVLPSDSGLQGADNGMLASAAGFLYVPGYDSSSVARIDLTTGQIQAQFIAAGSAGLLNSRGIVDEGTTILVGGEGNGVIYRFDAGNGSLIATLVSGLSRPTGLILDTNGTVLVLAGNRVRRHDPATGAFLGFLANGADGGISGGTFLALIDNPDFDNIFEDGFEPQGRINRTHR